ncbi:MAG: hypothetical protein NWT02_02265 [Opitutales bacterium]|jgi:hypothetical protein|nr:hypothetical protein [Opitutales bacterium]MDP4643202.1 hypothetical protein [Opitutales bacterium]MDP4693860.1 hypothetical protein [Opitutales bacterium]MDP4776500.1 hypothetical protein [Opitutales bacterium]MDP4882599.1 hypothetical protein [Opitutales bacterium]
MAADVESSGQRHVKESHRFLSPVLSVALMVGIAVHLAGFLIFRVVSNPLPTRDDRAAFVRYVSAGSLAGDLALEEQAQLFDSAPLFVPTQWNAAQNVSLAQRDRVRERFPEFEPAIDLLKALDNSDALIGSVDSVQQPGDLLASRFWVFFERFGQSDHAVQAFADVGHFAEIAVVGSAAQSAVTLDCPMEFTDPAPVNEPVQFYLRVGGDGRRLGEPLVSKSSGNEAFDRAARRWLQLPATVGRLPAGYLSVTVYP